MRMLASLLLLLRVAAAIRLPVEPLRWAADFFYTRQVSQMGLSECRLGVDVELRDAGARKGQGVFALRVIEEGELIGRYDAPICSRDESSESPYQFKLRDVPFVLDADDPTQSNWLRYINHSRRRCNSFPVPAYVSGINFAVVFQASERIQPGDELLFDYGTAYWDRILGSNRWNPQRVLVDYMYF